MSSSSDIDRIDALGIQADSNGENPEFSVITNFRYLRNEHIPWRNIESKDRRMELH
jgi:hypothetical protein